MLPINKVKEIISRYETLEKTLSQTDIDKNTYVKNSKEYSSIGDIIIDVKNYIKMVEDKESSEKILEDKSVDKELKEMAELELNEIKEKIGELETKIKIFMLPKDEADEKNAIIEIRAGTGGLEASLFAGDLFEMYQKVASNNGWKTEIISISDSDAGGYKEVVFSVTGKNVFSKLKFESGVHRVQRVPKTETQGRVHTSAATVAVLPEAEDVDVKIDENDLRIDVFRSSGPGGQSVNTTDSAVRITHIPSGIVVSQQDEKSQHKNKAKALKILRSKLYELERSKLEKERSSARKSQIGSGDRSERIRTYNFPQGRVTDHRINLTLHKLTDFLSGDVFSEISDALQIQFQEQQLES
ncbi:MAG: peptide chain release factor 1 [alpha proteobacterium HIMB114]|nr:MAG: peptide chain release factor 1 [alpha proteobacterium HIMB114]|tara:strand:- start:5719 stop:6786 length:1068 start_codon:yes stop_codon:yes gene_type:complete